MNDTTTNKPERKTTSFTLTGKTLIMIEELSKAYDSTKTVAVQRAIQEAHQRHVIEKSVSK